MSKLLVTGRKKLDGEVEVQGAKNSALPIIAASILTKGENVIHNCPLLSDVDASVNILRYLGCAVTRCDKTLLVKCDDINRFDVPVELMRKTRSSIVFLGAILARTGRARISFPGGCEIGSRPIDLHLNSLREMGADIREKHGYLECCVPNGLCGTKITLSFPSVGATEDIMIAACLAKGTTTIINAAREPEICDLADYLNSCGAAVTGSKIILNGIISSHLAALIPIFKNAGCKIRISDGNLEINAPERLKSMKTIRTMPFPGFPTDAQAPLLATACVADGTTVFVENIFENRYRHIPELVRMGAAVKTEGKVAVVEGVEILYGASVEAPDLRGGAALVVAGLCAEGKTEIGGVEYIERGYECIESTLTSIGADIKKI